MGNSKLRASQQRPPPHGREPMLGLGGACTGAVVRSPWAQTDGHRGLGPRLPLGAEKWGLLKLTWWIMAGGPSP